MDADSPIVRNLASSDIKTRDKAFQMLQSYVSQKSDLESLELMKMWKGLFFSMWHCDKPRNQQQLAVDFASLIHVLPKTTVVPWLEAFWTTMAREWVGIDALRMDKYLYLVRLYLRESFQHFAKSSNSVQSRLTEYIKVLRAVPLNPDNPQIPNGMRYHVVDVYVDELDSIDTTNDDDSVINQFLQPLISLGQKSPDKITRKRVNEALQDERARRWMSSDKNGNKNSAIDSEGTVSNEEEWEGIED